MKDFKKHRKGEMDALAFRNLPERAQEVWFQYCDIAIMCEKLDLLTFIHVLGLNYEECKSPIEVIFNFAFDLVVYSFDGIICSFFLQPQYKVDCEDRTYYLDFAFIAEDMPVEFENQDFKLAIECDGHNFHEKTKEQVARDNERDYDLKMLGFDVIRFSGSQIYNTPLKCAMRTMDYIHKKVGEITNGRC